MFITQSTCKMYASSGSPHGCSCDDVRMLSFAPRYLRPCQPHRHGAVCKVAALDRQACVCCQNAMVRHPACKSYPDPVCGPRAHTAMHTLELINSLLFMKTGPHWCMHQASLWLWEAGLRPIANLGSNSTVVFPAQHGWRHNLAGRRKLRLFFRPVNAMLHNAHQV